MIRKTIVAVVLVFRVAAADRMRGPDGSVSDVPAASVGYALKAGYTRIPQVWIRAPDGEAIQVDEDRVPRGAWRMTPEEIADMEAIQRTMREADEAATTRAKQIEAEEIKRKIEKDQRRSDEDTAKAEAAWEQRKEDARSFWTLENRHRSGIVIGCVLLIFVLLYAYLTIRRR